MEIFQPWFLTHQMALLRPATWIPRWREAAAIKAVLSVLRVAPAALSRVWQGEWCLPSSAPHLGSAQPTSK